MKITIDDMIEPKMDALEGIFEIHDLCWYQVNIENNGLSLDDAVGYLHRRAWRDVQHNEVKQIFHYFKEYIEKYNMRLE